MSDLPRKLEAARSAVFHACAVCRRVQSELSAIRSLTKDDRSPVTVADFASQAVVARTLMESLGDVVLVGEESAAELRRLQSEGSTELVEAVLREVRLVWPGATLDEVLDAIDVGAAEPPTDLVHGFWTLDPIDGTKGFLRGEQYSISLAWIENGAPVIGVLGCPNMSKDLSRPLDERDESGTIYWAEAGQGLYEVSARDAKDRATRIRRLEPAEGEPLRLCESVESGHTSHDDAEMIMERVGEVAEPLRLDGQGKYAVVGRGQADVYLRLPRKSGYVERIWDHAAGALVAAEGGCAVTDVRGSLLDFSRGKGLENNRGIVVAAPALHGRIMGAIGALGLFRDV
ncbi:MAG: 3'(2'),5'-bisphosphate nucleotidase [Planctomycetota bacterium]|nr:3'(2'),5'-bisphosphate nucleotidase [Planctomycetota bacterium]